MCHNFKTSKTQWEYFIPWKLGVLICQTKNKLATIFNNKTAFSKAGGDREKRKMAESWKELVAEIADKALSLRFLFELTGVNLQKMGKDHNTEKWT